MVSSSPSLTTSTDPAGRFRKGTLRWSAILIAVLLAIIIAAETGTRLLVPRISRIHGRTEREYAQVVAVAGDRPVMLFLGNSLLDAAVQFDSVKRAFSAEFAVRRLMIEQTMYYDWRYGIRRLFADGARPRTIVLMMSANHFASAGSRGEYSSYMLTTGGDVLDLCRDLDLHPTNAANMIVAHFSMFYAVRSEIRKVLLGRLMPELPVLTNRLTVVPATPIPEETLRSILRERASVLRNECSRYGARIVLAIPPGIKFPPAEAIREAASEAGVEVLIPFGPGQYDAADFSDGFHLNDKGAARFTTQLIDEMRASAGRWLTESN